MNRFEKAAIEVIQPFVKNKITHIIPEKSRNSVLSLDEAKTLAEAMDASARYGALNDTQVHLNGARITGFQNRAVENKRNTGWTKMMAGMSDPFANMPDKSKNVPDAFFPNHDAVWLPSGNPGIMMHELGHAADMNEFPNTPFRRFVAGTYQNFSPTLWKEHAAWIKGKNRLIEGAAKTKVDPNFVVRTLEDAARIKPVGLGSYWGGGLGAIMGGGLGFAAALKGAPPQASALGLVLGASAGALTGLQLGKMYGNSDRLGSEKSKQGYLDLYANQYAKEHGITLDKAKIELNNFIKAKKKPSTIRKAASFGGMFGRKFTPDRKLQMALIAEREKLVDDWYNGDMEDYATLNGNPEFNRRWNKAFNEKEEVEPRVIKGIPYPLYGSKPSWFPFRTQGMIDKAREEEYVRGDNEDAWDENDWKTERALRDDHTREGVNNILNHYLDRNHGIVKNPYRHPADLEDLEGRHVDYKGMVQKSVPWKPSTDIDNINALFEETQIGDYKPTANRQKLFDQYYPYLDLAPSAKPSKKGPIAKAAAFGAMMGKRAAEAPTSGPYPELKGKNYPNMQLRGGAANPAGALSGATDQVRLPAGYGGTDAAANAMTWNYSRMTDPTPGFALNKYPSTLGQARHSFHTNLTNQLKDANKFDKWNERMGAISDEQSSQAPVRHVEWPSKGYGPPRKIPGTLTRNQLLGSPDPHSSQLLPPPPIGKAGPGVKPGIMNTDIRPIGVKPYTIQYSYAPAGWGGPRQKKQGYPDSFVAQNNVRLHELTHTGYQNDRKDGVYTDSQGKPKSSKWDVLGQDASSAVQELGATWNEIGQGSRAFKDVTGKHMEGTHSFAPGMDMDYREMAELAKKYKVGDLHSPVGQKFMQQVLANSKSDTSRKLVDLKNPSIRDFNNEAANAAEAHFRKNLDLPYNEADPDAVRASLRAKFPERYGLVKPGPKFNAKGFITYPQQDGSYLPYGGYPYGPSR